MKHSSTDTDYSEMLRDLAIVEYVAGQQSGQTRVNFERLMSEDQTLQKSVEKEIKFRQSLLASNHIRPVEMDNFQNLLEKIHSDEAAPVDLVTTKANKKLFALPQRYYAVAASIAIIGIVSTSFLYDLTSPDYLALSDKTHSEAFDFNSLLTQHRVIRIEFSDDVSENQLTDQINALEKQYDLKALNTNRQTGVLLAVANKKVSASLLANLNANQVIGSAVLLASETDDIQSKQ